MASILIVDDEPNIVSSLQGALEREGHQVDGALSVAEARTRLREAYDAVLLDVAFPEDSGLNLLEEIGSSAPETTVIMMSGHASVEAAVRATKLGAFDFLEKPLSLERLLVVLRNASKAQSLQAENRRLRPTGRFSIVGSSPTITRLIEEIELAAPSTARVLIQGEHGTGKELVARALHDASPRKSMPFIAVNCSAIPEDLIESELFGHERGAFTGATQARRGRFEEAQGGTLFLDEVGDLSPRAQTKLLRVLQESELTRVGGNRNIKVDVRVVSATNRDLSLAASSGVFREDLYYRLAVIPLKVPPLRDRSEDVPRLVQHFSAQLAVETGRKAPTFTTGALDLLGRYAFPGNVRELRNIVERLLIMTRSARIGPNEVRGVLAGAVSSAEPAMRLGDAVRAFEKGQIEAALKAEGGNVSRAAARLGLERSHLYKKMRKLEMQHDTLKDGDR